LVTDLSIKIIVVRLNLPAGLPAVGLAGGDTRPLTSTGSAQVAVRIKNEDGTVTNR